MHCIDLHRAYANGNARPLDSREAKGAIPNLVESQTVVGGNDTVSQRDCIANDHNPEKATMHWDLAHRNVHNVEHTRHEHALVDLVADYVPKLLAMLGTGVVAGPSPWASNSLCWRWWGVAAGGSAAGAVAAAAAAAGACSQSPSLKDPLSRREQRPGLEAVALDLYTDTFLMRCQRLRGHRSSSSRSNSRSFVAVLEYNPDLASQLSNDRPILMGAWLY